MAFQSQRIRDPLHNLIEFEAEEFDNAMWKVIQTKPFQRLRRVKQLGLGELVYPGATHTRFAHSLGVFHTAKQLLRRIKQFQGSEYRLTRANAALAAALVHDVGHGPFSHAFEDVGKKLNLKMASHEIVSDRIIRDSEISEALAELGTSFSSSVADIIRSSGPKDIYCAVVSSQFDADRLDYMRRDRLMCGTQHGAIDYEWLVSNLQVGEVVSGVDEEEIGNVPTFVLGPKAIYAAESYLLGLFQLYPTVYYHKTTRGAEKLFSNLLIRVFRLASEGNVDQTGLPPNHPIIFFAKNPESLAAAQALDDFTIWGAVESMSSASDVAISILAQRLRDRKLLKAIDIFTDELLAEAKQSEDPNFLKKITERMQECLGPEQTLPGNLPNFLWDRLDRSLYKEFDKSKGPLNQIMIRMKDGRLCDVSEISPVIKAIGNFEGLRLYVDESDLVTRNTVKKAADEAVIYARGN